MGHASRDENFVPTLIGVSSSDLKSPVSVAVDPTTHRLLTDNSISSSLQTDIFTSTNLQTTFTASKVPVATIYLSVNGSIQTPSTDYTVSGSNAVLTNGIPSGNAVVWCYVIS